MTHFFNPERYWAEQATEHMDVASKTFPALGATFNLWLDACEKSVRGGGKILFFGNGGSAADAQHLATELAVRYISDRPAIPAIALTTDTSALTAIGNDMGFERIFSRQIEALGRPGDVAVAISTSGNSPNVIEGLKAARAQGIVTSGLSGRDGGEMKGLCDILLIVPSFTTARIQEMHIALGQILCGALEQKLGLAGQK